MENVFAGRASLKDSPIHGTGVYADKYISKGEKVIEYIGEKIDKEEAERRANRQFEMSLSNPSVGAVYIFELNDIYDIDGNVENNVARFINHSCEPNCEVEIDEDKIWIIALRDIVEGEEITYNYGYDIEDYSEHPCKCGSAKCVGYILAEDEWHKIKSN